MAEEQTPSEKGEWAGTADEGVVPPDLGGSERDEDPELGSEVLGKTTGSSEPATEEGVDLSAGDSADAVTDAGPELAEGVEPDLKDAAAAAPQVDPKSDH